MKRSKLFVLSGAVHAGKTTFMHRICRELQKEKLQLNGILSLTHFSGDEPRGYDGLNLQTGATFPLARLQGGSNWERAGRYFFDPEGINKAVKAILDFQDSDITVIDEIGPLELQGKGFWPALSSLRKNDHPTLIVVRENLVETVCEKTHEDTVVFHLKQDHLFEKMSEALLCLQK